MLLTNLMGNPSGWMKGANLFVRCVTLQHFSPAAQKHYCNKSDITHKQVLFGLHY